MRAGREDGVDQVYDKDGQILLYQDEYIVSQEKCFVASDVPDAPFVLTEVELFLTNWRLVAMGPRESVVHVDTVSDYGHRHYRVRPGISQYACPFLEVFLDEVQAYKKSLLGELRLRMLGGTVDLSELSKPFRQELLKALEWYLTPQ